MTSEQRDLVAALTDRYGTTYARAAGIRLERNQPAPLFQLLCLALLASARISAEVAVDAFKALVDDGLTTADAMADATWERRTRLLNRSGYARYDESTSRYLGATAELVIDRYGGDLRELRAAAGRDRDREHQLLTECKGIGEVGASLFLREVQAVWDEVVPYVDERAGHAAEALGLPSDAAGLHELVEDPGEFAVLVSALVRCDLDDGAAMVRRAAGATS